VLAVLSLTVGQGRDFFPLLSAYKFSLLFWEDFRLDSLEQKQ